MKMAEISNTLLFVKTYSAILVTSSVESFIIFIFLSEAFSSLGRMISIHSFYLFQHYMLSVRAYACYQLFYCLLRNLRTFLLYLPNLNFPIPLNLGYQEYIVLVAIM
ncbi:hypothetical protein SAMN05444392_11627 [Seinonella peptonophila]|uniref:Uncharacterized protein n=1 Tax=Seinonella peptonophila TaxID=112248 RepID=A0A1M5AVY1_9BACL|nr:hypothetical protein SAMN05444392_11627 [Seinonella peptonophila]